MDFSALFADFPDEDDIDQIKEEQHEENVANHNDDNKEKEEENGDDFLERQLYLQELEEKNEKNKEELKRSDLIHPLQDFSTVFEGTKEWQEKYEEEVHQKQELNGIQSQIVEDLQKLYQFVQVPIDRTKSFGWFPLPIYYGAKKPDIAR